MIESSTTSCVQRAQTLAHVWLPARLVLLGVFIILPFAFYDIEAIKSAWYAPIMGVVAASIPASGIPVAGGIVFVPLLTVAGVCPRDAIIFTAATQTLGVGVFAPLNWLLTKPEVFDCEALKLAVPAALLGDFVALALVPASNDQVVVVAFATFCVFMALYTARGLYTNLFVSVKRTQSGANLVEEPVSKPVSGVGTPVRLDSPPKGQEPASPSMKVVATKASNSRAIDRVIFVISSFVGGMLTAYIGVGVEKVLFLWMTCGPRKRLIKARTDVQSAGLTSIAVVGWVSAFSVMFSLSTPCGSTLANGFTKMGELPTPIWMCGLPGIMIGSMVGPKLAAAVGPQKILILFCVMLFAESFKEFYTTYKGGIEECICKHENNVLRGNWAPLSTVIGGGALAA